MQNDKTEFFKSGPSQLGTFPPLQLYISSDSDMPSKTDSSQQIILQWNNILELKQQILLQ